MNIVFEHAFAPTHGSPLPNIEVLEADFGQWANQMRSDEANEAAYQERRDRLRQDLPGILGEYAIKFLGRADTRAQMETIIAHMASLGVERPIFRGHDATVLVPNGTLYDGALSSDKALRSRERGFYATNVERWREENHGGRLSQVDPFFHMLFQHHVSHGDSPALNEYPSLVVYSEEMLTPTDGQATMGDPDIVHYKPRKGFSVEETVVGVYYHIAYSA